MFIEAELILKVIETQQLTRIVVFDIDRQNKLDYFQGTPEAVKDRFISTLNVMQGAFRVECGTKDDEVATGGRKSEKRAPFVWRVMGRKGQAEPGTPDKAAPASDLPAGQLQMALSIQRLELTLEMEKQKREQLEAMLEEEEEEEDEEPQQSGTMSQREMVELFREMFREMRSPNMRPADGTQKAITGTASGELLDAEFKEALEHWQRTNPEDFKSQFGAVRETVMKSYNDAKGQH